MVDVREAVGGESVYEPLTAPRSFIKPKVNKELSVYRMEMLERYVDDLNRCINNEPIGDTSDNWKDAYEMLHKAILNCIAEEKILLVK